MYPILYNLGVLYRMRNIYSFYIEKYIKRNYIEKYIKWLIYESLRYIMTAM